MFVLNGLSCGVGLIMKWCMLPVSNERCSLALLVCLFGLRSVFALKLTKFPVFLHISLKVFKGAFIHVLRDLDLAS